MKRIKAIFFLLTFSSSLVGYSFEMHYCKGEVTDISFFGHAECFCGSANGHNKDLTPEETCIKHCHAQEDENNAERSAFGKCCKTERLTFVSGNLKALSTHTMPDFHFVLAAVFNPYIFTEFYAVTAKCPTEYTPPILEKDINVLFRTFLI